jgi:hypothetical protein
MNTHLDFLLLMTLAASVAMPAEAQVALSVGPADGATQRAALVPDFSGLWGHPSWPGFEPPPSGPGPVTNRARLGGGPQKGVSNPDLFVGDYTNPILKPKAAEEVKKHGQIELSGVAAPTPSNQCWPQPVPYIFWNIGIQLLQQPDKVTILYNEDHQVRRVRLNQPHPALVTPSWYGDSVGHYEGDTLVIDTVGIKTGRPYAMVDMYGTPYTEALHVVERYRLLDYEAAKEGLARDAKENFDLQRASPGLASVSLFVDPNYRGKHLQLQFTVDDEGIFTMPWSATITYRPGVNARGFDEWPEIVCAENTHEYYAGKDTGVPQADNLDF